MTIEEMATLASDGTGDFSKLRWRGLFQVNIKFAETIVCPKQLKCVIHHEMVTVTCESASLKSSADVKLDPITTVADVVTIDLTGGTFDVSGATLDGVVVVDVNLCRCIHYGRDVIRRRLVDVSVVKIRSKSRLFGTSDDSFSLIFLHLNL